MKKEFIVDRNGKSFVLYAGLLDEAHSQGLREIQTELVQSPQDSNGQVAIAHARVCTEKGCFSGLGDASPANVSNMLSSCLVRMAETRAKARALRDAVNVGIAAVEELADDADIPEASGSAVNPATRHVRMRKPLGGESGSKSGQTARFHCSNEGCGREITKGQYEYSQKTFGQPLCPSCQRQRSGSSRGFLSLNE